MSIILEYRDKFNYEYKNDKLDDFQLQFRSNRKCKKCLGRGKLNFDNPRTKEEWTETCSCIHKGAKR